MGVTLIRLASCALLAALLASALALGARETDGAAVSYEMSIKVRRGDLEQTSTITGAASAEGTRELVTGAFETWSEGEVVLSRPGGPRDVLRPARMEYRREALPPEALAIIGDLVARMKWREFSRESVKHAGRDVRRVRLTLEYGVGDPATIDPLSVFDAEFLVDAGLATVAASMKAGVAFDPLRALPRLPGDLSDGAIVGFTISDKRLDWEARLIGLRPHPGSVDLTIPTGFKRVEK